ncbi:hypothetical protein FRC00_013220 [Tulasnella sp. 408]|nr:hypothetical protein FRC00_013220 [Tulasnella sp. 408]
MRTHQQVLEALKEIAEARTKKEKERLQTFWGLTGKKSYIFHFPGADFVSSTPFDFMHMMLTNNTKNYTKILQGKFKTFDSDDFVLPAAVWTEIGNEIVAANRTIPAAFVSYLPDIWKERSSYTAELYSFWIVYAAPILLHQRLPSPYYEHLVKFGTIIKYCLKLTITTEELEELEEMCISWVEEYERLYYRYDPSRLPFCTSNIHGMLHIPDDIRISGPLWTAWAFVMERICSLTVRAVKSRLNPFGSLNQYFKRIAQLSHIRNKYNLSSHLEPDNLDTQDGGEDNDLTSSAAPAAKLSRFEEQVTGYPTTILRAPRQKEWVPNKPTRTKIAKYFVIPYSLNSWSEIMPHLPHTVQRWCKFRIDGGDSVRGSEAMKGEQQQLRDSSFVRFELLSSSGKRLVLYGQFHYAIVVTLRPVNTRNVCIPVKRTWILGYITPYKTGNVDATEALASFTDRDQQTSQFFDIRTIQAVVGRIKTRGRWYIVDRSEGCARTVFVDDETPPIAGGGREDISYPS